MLTSAPVKPLRTWTLTRVLLTGAAWFVLALVACVLWIVAQTVGTFYFKAGSGGGIGAVSVGVNTLMLLIPVAPPIALLVSWLVLRRSTR
jgi:hypothetical protein